MDDLQKFVREYNAVRNANFIMWAALLADLAASKGANGEEWIKDLRALALKELDATKMQNPAEEFSAETAQIAEMARSVIGNLFSMAEDRHRKHS